MCKKSCSSINANFLKSLVFICSLSSSLNKIRAKCLRKMKSVNLVGKTVLFSVLLEECKKQVQNYKKTLIHSVISLHIYNKRG